MEKRKPRGYWTLERCIEDAAQYETKAEWRRSGQGGYAWAHANGVLDEACSHMDNGRTKFNKDRTKWTKEACIESAKKYATKEEWRRGELGAYGMARQNGWFDECVMHMTNAPHASDNDVVYIWRESDTELHKIGVTSNRVGESRISMCANSNGMDPRIVFMLKVEDARAVEAELLKLGVAPELDSSIDGYTEFRELTNDDLREAVGIAYRAALKEVNHARS